MNSQQTKTCRKVPDVLIDAKVVVERGYDGVWPNDTAERQAGRLDAWARELYEFFRDHRSMDVNRVYVERTHQDQCSVCHREWEPYDDEDTGETCCSGCGAIVLEAQ